MSSFCVGCLKADLNALGVHGSAPSNTLKFNDDFWLFANPFARVKGLGARDCLL